MSQAPFAARKIVVTRARTQAEPLVEAIVERGGEVISLPLLEIRDARDGGGELRTQLASLVPDDWLVVLSPNGARRIVSQLEADSCHLAVVASGTAVVFEDAGWTVDLLPSTASSEGLLESFVEMSIESKILIAQAEGGRQNLVRGLRDRGVDVVSVVAYRNIAPIVDADAAEAARGADTVVFASPSAVMRYVDVVGVVPELSVCIGSVTAVSARNAGFAVMVASEPSTNGLITALASIQTMRPDPARPQKGA